MMSDFKENKLVFFEGGNAEKFVPKIQAVEKKVQEEKEKTEAGKGKDDIVDESKVQTKINDIEKRIKESPVNDKYKEKIGKSLTTLLDKREQDLKKVDTKKEEKLKELFAKIVKDLDDFDKQPDVKEIYETIEPFFKQKDKIKPVINLSGYRRKSGFWKGINKKINELGINDDQITKLQKLLKAKTDGKVGPQTINAISQMLELGINTKFGDKTVYTGEIKSEEEKGEGKGPASEKDETQTDGKEDKPKTATKPGGPGAASPTPTDGKPTEPSKSPAKKEGAKVTRTQQPENQSAKTKEPEISAEERERISKDFNQVKSILSGIGVQVNIDQYIKAYIDSGQKVPTQNIIGNFRILEEEINKAPNDLRECIKAEQGEIVAALGMFANGYGTNAENKIQAIVGKVRIEHEAHAHIQEMEKATAIVRQKAEAAKQKAETYLHYAYVINGKIKSPEKNREGREHKYDLDNYLVAQTEVAASLEEFVKTREAFTGKDNPIQRETALNRVIKEKIHIGIAAISQDPGDHLGVSVKVQNLNLPLTRAEFEQIKNNAALNLLFARRQNYLETGDEKFKKDFEKSQQIITASGALGAQSDLDNATKKDDEQISEDPAVEIEKKALKDLAQKDTEKIVKDFDQAGKLRASDPGQCYAACIKLQEKLENCQKFGNDHLGLLPNLQAAYLKIMKNYSDENKKLVLDSINNNPQINDYKESATLAVQQTQGAVASMSRLFEQIAKGEDVPSESFMQVIHELAQGVISNQNLQKLSNHPATGFIRNFKYLEFKGKDDFRGQINLAVNGMYKTMDNLSQYHQNANRLSNQAIHLEGSASTFKTFCKQTGKELAIVTVAVGAAVLAGMAVASTGGLAGAGILAVAGNFAITTGVTSLAAAVTTQYTRAIIEGDTSHIETGTQLKAWGQGAMYSALGGVGGVVLGKGIGTVASKIAQSSTGLSQRAAVFAAKRAEDMFIRASGAGTKAEGGVLSQLRHFAREVASETGEELTEDAMQKIGEGLAPSHPELGFVFSLIPAATKSARGTFMNKTVGISPRPGITGKVSDDGVNLKYSDPAEVIDLLKSRNMPARIITEFEQTGKINGKIGGVNFQINKTAEPVALRQGLTDAKGVKTANEYGIKYNEANGTYEYNNKKNEAKVIEFFKKKGALVETGPNSETILIIDGKKIELKALKTPVETKAKSDTESISIRKNIEEVQSIEELYRFLDAQNGQFEEVDVKQLKKGIKKYVDSNGEIKPKEITKKGGLRGKVIELVELKKIQEIGRQISSSKRKVDVQLDGQVRIEEASKNEIESALQRWLGAKSADQDWGVIVEEGHAAKFRKSAPSKLEMKFKDGTVVRLIFPKRLEADMKRLQADVVSMEKWIQTRFGEQGIKPNQTLTILLMEDSTGLKSIRGHAGRTSILLNASDLKNRQEFVDTYLHERTHAVLGQEGLNPVNNGVIEGIANYMAAEGVAELGLGRAEILRRSADRAKVSKAILTLVKSGKSFEEAFNEYFEKHHNDEEHGLNYEYGQAFTEAMIRHFQGDLGPFLKLYAELGSYRSRFSSQKVSELYRQAMDRVGISNQDIGEIFKLTSATVMLKAYRGNELIDALLYEKTSNIEAILREQKLETFFGLTNATLRQLENHVTEAKRYAISSAGIMHRSNAARIIQILDVKLLELKNQKGASGKTQYV